MTGSSVAGVITAVATVLTAAGGLFLALAVFLPALRKTQRDVEKVHVIVNQQRTDAKRYQERLIEALHSAGVPVPTDSSLRPKGENLGDPQTS